MLTCSQIIFGCQNKKKGCLLCTDLVINISLLIILDYPAFTENIISEYILPC